MSASAKPPQTKTVHSREQIARGLLTAELLGDRWAAQALNVHYRTIQNWRQWHRDDADIQAIIAHLREKVDEAWIKRVTEARMRLLGRVVELAGTSRNLRHVTDAFRRVNEASLASEILKDGVDAERLIPDLGGAPQEAEGEARGRRSEERDSDADEDDPA